MQGEWEGDGRVMGQGKQTQILNLCLFNHLCICVVIATQVMLINIAYSDFFIHRPDKQKARV